MSTIRLPANYYQQFDADFSREMPGNVDSATVTPSGELYFSAGADLFRVRG